VKADLYSDAALAMVLRRCADLLDENDHLRALVESMALNIPVEHMGADERRLLAEVLGST
jgi:hypothetical protein